MDSSNSGKESPEKRGKKLKKNKTSTLEGRIRESVESKSKKEEVSKEFRASHKMEDFREKKSRQGLSTLYAKLNITESMKPHKHSFPHLYTPPHTGTPTHIDTTSAQKPGFNTHAIPNVHDPTHAPLPHSLSSPDLSRLSSYTSIHTHIPLKFTPNTSISRIHNTNINTPLPTHNLIRKSSSSQTNQPPILSFLNIPKTHSIFSFFIPVLCFFM